MRQQYGAPARQTYRNAVLIVALWVIFWNCSICILIWRLLPVVSKQTCLSWLSRVSRRGCGLLCTCGISDLWDDRKVCSKCIDTFMLLKLAAEATQGACDTNMAITSWLPCYVPGKSHKSQAGQNPWPAMRHVNTFARRFIKGQGAAAGRTADMRNSSTAYRHQTTDSNQDSSKTASMRISTSAKTAIRYRCTAAPGI